MDREAYWKTFESTGSVEEYLHYKEAAESEQGPKSPAGEGYANGNTGSGSASGEGGGE